MGDAFLIQNIKKQPALPSIIEDGLQLYLDASNSASYPGSGSTWFDLSGNNRNASLINSPSYNTEANGVLIFNGSNQQANLGTWFTFQNFTISTWIKPGTSQKAYADIFDNNHTGTRNWVCQQNNMNLNQYSFTVLPSNGVSSSTGNFNLNSNTWYNLTVTFDNSRVRGYLNGSLFATGNAVTSTSIYSQQNFVIANWANGGRQWNGRIGEFLVYNRALSLQEIEQNFNATKSKFGL